MPNNCQPTICDNHMSGAQYSACSVLRNAHFTPSQLKPLCK